MSDTPMLLQLQNATVMKQNRKRVLDCVSLAIKEGEHTAILGPNGSGKSSLIKLITRQHYALVHPDGAPSMLIYGRERWNVFEPRALVLDEPTTGLDLLASHRFLETLRTIARHGKTIILVTHHIEEILPEIQRVILLKDGRVFLDGPKDVVLTTHHISALFAAPIHIQAGAAGYYKAVAGERLHELTEEPSSLGATGHQRIVAKS